MRPLSADESTALLAQILATMDDLIELDALTASDDGALCCFPSAALALRTEAAFGHLARAALIICPADPSKIDAALARHQNGDPDSLMPDTRP